MRNRTPSDRAQLAVTDAAFEAPLYHNAQDLKQELAWCEAMIKARIDAYFSASDSVNDGWKRSQTHLVLPEPPCFKLSQRQSLRMEINESEYARFVIKSKLNSITRLALALAIASEIRPSVFDLLLTRNEATGLPFFEFGIQVQGDRPYVTGETLAFILSGLELPHRFQVQDVLQALMQGELTEAEADKEANFKLLGEVIELDMDQSDSIMQAALKIKSEALHRFTTCRPLRPECSHAFPAQYVATDLEWDQLILPKEVKKQVEEIQDYILYGETLIQQWGMKGKIRPGYRALFYGPPGTGKTLTASLLGKVTGHAVYRIDISLLVSKYIGETEKNLEKVFSMAENKKWILLFDEADALFGKRNQANSANDQFANQNVAYLLQRIETFNGVAILASNFKDNLDDAFYRRFESMVYFSLPDATERLSLWQKGFSEVAVLDEDIELSLLAKKYRLSGANIMNVIRYASMQTIRRSYTQTSTTIATLPRYDIRLEDLEHAIAKELEAHVASDVLLKGQKSHFFADD